jgi:hypothetical protein
VRAASTPQALGINRARTPKLPPTSCVSMTILSCAGRDCGDLTAHAAYTLQRQIQRVAPARGIECDETRARFERIAHHALAVDGESAHVLRARERRGGCRLVARLELEGEIAGVFAGRVGVELGCVRSERGIESDYRAQIAIFDLDQVTRIFGDRR